MSVFQIDRNHKIIVNPEAAKLVPELSSLTEKQLWYVILVADYVDSPLRKRPPEERRQLAARKVYGKDKVIESDRVKNAIEAYRGCVFDIRRENVDALKTKVLQLHRQLLKDNVTYREIADIDKSINFLETRITSIERDLDIEEKEEIEIKGKKKLSMIELWQRNQRKYAEYKDSF